MESGTIKAVRTDRGFGFIKHSQGGPDVFFHCSELEPRLTFDETLLELRVAFDIDDSPKGPRAVDVRKVV